MKEFHFFTATLVSTATLLLGNSKQASQLTNPTYYYYTLAQRLHLHDSTPITTRTIHVKSILILVLVFLKLFYLNICSPRN